MNAAARLRRRLDRRFYRALYALVRALFPAGAPPGPMPPARVRRVLVARTDRVGDAVVLTPTLSYLRAVLPPDAEVDVVTSAAATLLRGDPRVTSVVAPRPGPLGWLRLVRALRARRYDVVLSVRVYDHLAEGLTAALAARRGGVRATVRRPAQHAGFFTHQLRLRRGERHILTRWLALAQSAVGDGGRSPDVARSPAGLARDAAAEARARDLAAAWGGRPYVALNAWGSDERRCFGPALAAEVAAGIAARHPGLAVVLTPPPAAAAEADEIVRLAAARLAGAGDAGAAARVAAAPPSADLRDLVARLRLAAAVVTPDTANMHVASAVGTPLVAVYTSYTRVEEWGAWGTQPLRVVHHRARAPLRDVPAAADYAAFDALRAALATPPDGPPGALTPPPPAPAPPRAPR